MLTLITKVKREQIAKRIKAIERKLAPNVVHIRYDIGEDWSGDPSISFRILLSDEASQRDRLRETARRVRAELEKLNLIELGLLSYHSFRNESEQAKLKEESWA